MGRSRRRCEPSTIGRPAVTEVHLSAPREASPHALDDHVVFLAARAGAQGGQGRQQAVGVIGGQRPADAAFALGQGGAHVGPAGDALGAGRRDRGIEPVREGRDGQRVGQLVETGGRVDHEFLRNTATTSSMGNPVVALDGIVLVVFHLRADRDDPPGEGWYLDLVGQVDADLGHLAVLILADQDPVADRLHRLQRLGLRLGLGHGER
jgi:hypothetical protein